MIETSAKWSIPIYPEFREISLEDKGFIDSIFTQSKPYSDFSFTNLYVWRPNSELAQISTLHKNLVIKVKNIISNTEEVSFLGINNTYDTMVKLLESRQSLDIVPLIVVKSLDPQDKVKFEISEDEDNFDYIMSITELSTLEGYKYTWKRRDINRLASLGLESTITIGELNTDTKEKIIKLYYKWLEQKRLKNANIPIENEINAFHIFMETQVLHKDLLTTCVFDNGKLVSFSFNQLIHDRYVLGLFAKGDYDYPGIGSHTELLTATALRSYGFLYLNYEQDLGISSLRNYKLSLSPIGFLKKYKIQIR